MDEYTDDGYSMVDSPTSPHPSTITTTAVSNEVVCCRCFRCSMQGRIMIGLLGAGVISAISGLILCFHNFYIGLAMCTLGVVLSFVPIAPVCLNFDEPREPKTPTKLGGKTDPTEFPLPPPPVLSTRNGESVYVVPIHRTPRPPLKGVPNLAAVEVPANDEDEDEDTDDAVFEDNTCDRQNIPCI